MAYSLKLYNKAKWFVDKYGDGISKAIRGTNLYFPAVVALKVVESGWGKSDLTQKDFNFGGIKCNRNLEGVIGCREWTTNEYIKGKKVSVKRSFSIFKDVESGIRGTIQVMLLPRYKEARDKATSPRDQIIRLVNAKYSTTPAEKYADKIQDIMDAVQDYSGLGRIK